MAAEPRLALLADPVSGGMPVMIEDLRVDRDIAGHAWLREAAVVSAAAVPVPG